MTHYYLMDIHGRLRFTRAGKELLTPIFAKHGIDIHTITTRRDYVLARLRVRPDFLYEKWLNSPTSPETKPASVEQQLLREAIFGHHTPEEFQRVMTKTLKRASFSVFQGGR